ncbi:hypothetical protein ACQPZQ_29080 [Pseudonocardia sp. CA-142604]|uniref:hypothetical protein n=1 Tax=Pseudonocardia sp. CA-142604 TaxID=3240024 RepID=UPI003D919BCA
MARRLHVYVDDERAADLHVGATTRMPVEAGPHLLRVRCFPLIGADLPVILAPHETLQVAIYIDAFRELKIDIAAVAAPARPQGTTGR